MAFCLTCGSKLSEIAEDSWSSSYSCSGCSSRWHLTRGDYQGGSSDSWQEVVPLTEYEQQELDKRNKEIEDYWNPKRIAVHMRRLGGTF